MSPSRRRNHICPADENGSLSVLPSDCVTSPSVFSYAVFVSIFEGWRCGREKLVHLCRGECLDAADPRSAGNFVINFPLFLQSLGSLRGQPLHLLGRNRVR